MPVAGEPLDAPASAADSDASDDAGSADTGRTLSEPPETCQGECPVASTPCVRQRVPENAAICVTFFRPSGMTRDDPAAFAPPPAFGPFRVLHQIGVGALGPVFRTYEPTRDRLVAVKVFR